MIAARVAVCCPANSQNQALATEGCQQGSEMTNDQKITQSVQAFGLISVQTQRVSAGLLQMLLFGPRRYRSHMEFMTNLHC